jgi:predicted ATP-dependent protease
MSFIADLHIHSKYSRATSPELCFEQLYGGIDGDSASSAEIYAILSSLAELPIQQGIAVTGSVNQKGEIQPIGGVTIKIEGFYELCRLRGLNGKQGVIIPYQNIKNLMLDYEILEAVRDGKFNIYAVRSIDEGIEILTGVSAGKRLRGGAYPADTVNFRVCEKLKKYAKMSEENKIRKQRR